MREFKESKILRKRYNPNFDFGRLKSMVNICMTRIDERLIHGQVTVKWIQFAKCTRIIIVDDEIVNDQFFINIFRMSLPDQLKFDVFNVDEAVKVLNKGKANDKVMVLVKFPSIIKRLYDKGIKFREIIIGRIPAGEGKTKFYDNVFLSPEDIEIFEYLISKNISIKIQMVPDSPSVELANLLYENKGGVIKTNFR
jgi:PTS system mannose-specific IIB component